MPESPWWAIALFQFAVASAFGVIVFRLGTIYGAEKERQKPRTLSAAQVLQDRLDIAVSECLGAGKTDLAKQITERAGRARVWVTHRVLVNTEDRPC